MALGIYLNFEKETKEVIEFYEHVFNVKCTDMTTFGSISSNPGFPPLMDDMKELIVNASLIIEGTKVMFSDVPEFTGQKIQRGNNVSILLELNDEEKLTQQFNDLAKEGKVVMPLGKTFFSEKYGFVIDKFGTGWQFNFIK